MDLQALSGLDALLLGPAAVSCAPQLHADAASHICRAVLQAVRTGGGVILPVSDTGEGAGVQELHGCMAAWLQAELKASGVQLMHTVRLALHRSMALLQVTACMHACAH
jgi:hypothetical protein